MKHYSHQGRNLIKSDVNVEFGEEFGMIEPLDRESSQALQTAKAGGMITKRLADSGKSMWSSKSEQEK